MLTIPHCKEALSEAYVTAVVGRARHSLTWTQKHDYGIDGFIRLLQKTRDKIEVTGWGFDFQAKSTVDWSERGQQIIYELQAEAFNSLARRSKNTTMPFLLILMCLPRNDQNWLSVSHGELTLRRCAFWYKVEDQETENSRSKVIAVPKSNLFTPDALAGLLSKIKEGEDI